MAEVLEREILLRCSPAQAFRVFTEQVDLWWPRGHRKSTDGTLRLERRRNGRLLDVAPDGSAWTMAVVIEIVPPERLTLDWFPGSPAAPTRVEIAFEGREGGTRIRIVHTAPTPEAAVVWPQRVQLFTRGWEAVLRALRAHIDIEGE